MMIKAILIVLLTVRIVQEVKRLSRVIEFCKGQSKVYEDTLSEQGIPTEIIAQGKRKMIGEAVASVVLLVVVYVWVCFTNLELI